MDTTKALLDLAVNVITLGVTWLVGQRVVSYWTARQKRKELQLQVAGDFYKHYGQFRGVWKSWNDALAVSPAAQNMTPQDRAAFISRAMEAEGGMEAVLLKVAAERRLQPEDQQNLGNLRQAFQVLHERIRDARKVSYGVSEDPDYLEFKRLSTWFGNLLASPPEWEPPSANEAYEAFREITHNKYEPRWKGAGRKAAG